MNAGNKKHTQHAPSTKTECDYLNGWIKKRSHTQKSHQKVVNPRDLAGECKKKKKKKKKKICSKDCLHHTSHSLAHVIKTTLQKKSKLQMVVMHTCDPATLSNSFFSLGTGDCSVDVGVFVLTECAGSKSGRVLTDTAADAVLLFCCTAGKTLLLSIAAAVIVLLLVC